MQHCMCRLPVSAAAESRTDAAAAGSSGEQNLQSGGSGSYGNAAAAAAVRLSGWFSAGVWL